MYNAQHNILVCILTYSSRTPIVCMHGRVCVGVWVCVSLLAVLCSAAEEQNMRKMGMHSKLFDMRNRLSTHSNTHREHITRNSVPYARCGAPGLGQIDFQNIVLAKPF